MEDSKVLSELVKALKNIQDELQQINRNLSVMAAKSGQSAGQSEDRPVGRPSMGRPTGRPPARSPRTGGYGRTDSRSEMSGGPATGEKESSRFPKKKSGPSRPKGKLPAKKGDGYPKKAR